MAVGCSLSRSCWVNTMYCTFLLEQYVLFWTRKSYKITYINKMQYRGGHIAVL